MRRALFKFEAAHRLPKLPQTHRCHRMHGHSYRIEVVLNGPVDPHTAFVVDFFEPAPLFAETRQIECARLFSE
ncbi:hypothetical protein FXV83_17055 [Bradyrhizobium hipponense]|uniref:6-carboxy-5,6,7,8-tetrahydropterin synthase n=1 Tax=Bradyrhizobium hipponense TaxID=2605638 RepID=A0A5S4YN33_9BRAD|nr:hypothetical protein [Bradyrhizobium sp. CSA207]TYO65403.1 hypothetical protein FXV83_17055 [Bradyrhizobium hipponense]